MTIRLAKASPPRDSGEKSVGGDVGFEVDMGMAFFLKQ
jgi:hypothetical protein